jgi:hypothetical protein
MLQVGATEEEEEEEETSDLATTVSFPILANSSFIMTYNFPTLRSY